MLEVLLNNERELVDLVDFVFPAGADVTGSVSVKQVFADRRANPGALGTFDGKPKHFQPRLLIHSESSLLGCVATPELREVAGRRHASASLRVAPDPAAYPVPQMCGEAG